jgi:hypothetical protein
MPTAAAEAQHVRHRERSMPQPRRCSCRESALLMNNDSTTVLVEVSPWTFERRTVELGYDERHRYARV